MENYYQSTNNYQLRKIANQTFLFPVGKKADELQGAIVLNEMSEYVWNLIHEPLLLEEIISKIEDVYDTENVDLRSFIVPLLNQFEAYGVLEQVSKR